MNDSLLCNSHIISCKKKTLKHVDIQLYQSNQTQVLKNNDYRYYQNIWMKISCKEDKLNQEHILIISNNQNNQIMKNC